MMQLCAVTTDATLRETQSHGSPAFPLGVYLDDMDSYPGQLVPWHWHAEVELGVMLRGRVQVNVGGESFSLCPGEGFFINAGALHSMQPLAPGAVFFSVVFLPRLLYGTLGSAIETNYVTPLLQSPGLRWLHLAGATGWQADIVSALRLVNRQVAEKQPGYELAVQAALCGLWQTLYTSCGTALPAPPQSRLKDEARMKQMLDFIHTHYAEDVTLAGIAAAAAVSESECCRCFKRLMGCSPFACLHEHRLAVAAGLLEQGLPATEVARQTGYNSQSHFGQHFKRRYGCTPGGYKKQRPA